MDTTTRRDTLREQINRYSDSTAILAVIGMALDAQVTGATLAPALQLRANEVLGALGLESLTDGVRAADLQHLLAELRFKLLLDTKLFLHTTHSLAWTHSESEILQAGGDISIGFADLLTHTIVPRLAGLSERLASPEGTFLDVGVGVAGLSIALARLWPLLRVVGIDPWAPSLALAHENVRSAGLAERVELREQAVEDISDANAFDLAWLPSAFIPEQAIPAACNRVYRALRPGGWLLFAMANPGTDPLTAALVRLRTVFWGGSLMAAGQVETLLHQAGFANVRLLPSPPGAVVALIAAQRLPEIDDR